MIHSCFVLDHFPILRNCLIAPQKLNGVYFKYSLVAGFMPRQTARSLYESQFFETLNVLLDVSRMIAIEFEDCILELAPTKHVLPFIDSFFHPIKYRSRTTGRRR